MSTLYIRLPSKAAADSAANWLALPCAFAQVANGSAIVRQGAAPLSELSGALATAQRVVLLLAASDVTLLRVKVPPLSAAKLKAALPNLVEDQLISDPSDCVVVAGGVADGLRTVAVAKRAWLDLLAKTLISFGARRFEALPASMCLPCQTDSVSAAINEQEVAGQYTGIDLTLRLTEQDGIGLAIKPVLSQVEGIDQHGSAAHEVIQTLCAVVSEAPVALYVPQSSVWAYQDAINQTGALNGRFSVHIDNWSHWIAGAGKTTLNLMAGMSAGSASMPDWKAWRWPLALAATLLVVNAAALNIDWWRMKSEAHTLRTSMTQIYRSAYPKESVIVDPIAQMKQKIAAAKHDSGQAAPDDFIALSAAFGEAWAAVMPAGKTSPSAITGLEYRERSLYVRLKPLGDASTQQIKTALADRNLSLDPQSEQSSLAVWRIRSVK